MPDETFTIHENTMLRCVTPKRGKPYEHSCSHEIYKDVAFAIETLGGESFTGEAIRDSIDAPFTQVMTALAFLKERGSIVPTRGRRHEAASTFVFEDALIEWFALRDGAPGSTTTTTREEA